MMRDDMMVSNGLAFPVVAPPGVGHMPAKGEYELEAARVFYVAGTRATQRLVIGMGGQRFELFDDANSPRLMQRAI